MIRLALLSISVSLFAAACGDDNHGATPTPDAGAPADASTTPITVVVTPPVGLVAVSNSTDFSSSSVSLLNADGTVAKGDCFSSATAVPGATAALSGDVALPSWAQFNNEVAVIDRTNAVITWLDPTSCAVLRQLDVSTGYPANPQDVISVASNKAYVTRYEPNKAAGKKPFDGGNDLLIIDPTKPAITGRIDLSDFAVPTSGTTIHPRANRARLIDGKLYVEIDNFNDGFKVVTHGRIVVIDVQTDNVTGVIDTPDVNNNCASLSYLDDKHLLNVACNGQIDFSGGPVGPQIAESAVLTYDLSQSLPAIVHTQPASAFNAPIVSYSGLARDGALGFVAVSGDFSTTKDQLFALDTATGTSTLLKTAADFNTTYAHVIVDPVAQRMFVADATAEAPGLLVYGYGATDAPKLSTTVNVSPKLNLLPVEIEWR